MCLLDVWAECGEMSVEGRPCMLCPYCTHSERSAVDAKVRVDSMLNY